MRDDAFEQLQAMLEMVSEDERQALMFFLSRYLELANRISPNEALPETLARGAQRGLSPQILQHIRNAAPFAQLERAQQTALAAAVQALHCQTGDLLTQQGQPLPGLLLLASGAAQEQWQGETGALQQGAELRAGDYRGAEALFNELPAQNEPGRQRGRHLGAAADDDGAAGACAARPAVAGAPAGRRRASPRPQRWQRWRFFRGQRRGERVLTLRRASTPGPGATRRSGPSCWHCCCSSRPSWQIM